MKLFVSKFAKRLSCIYYNTLVSLLAHELKNESTMLLKQLHKII